MPLWRFRVVYDGLGSHEDVTTMYFQPPGGVSAAQIATAIKALFDQQSGVTSPIQITRIFPEYDVIDPATGAVLDVVGFTPPTITVSSGTGDPLPLSTQVLVRLKTTTVAGGRRIQGRWFLPGVTETYNGSAGLPAPIIGTNLATPLTGLIADGLSVYSVKNRVAANVTSASVALGWGVLRKRRAH